MVVLKPGLPNVFIALGLVYWLRMARIVRAQVLGLKELEFVLAARVLGAGPWRSFMLVTLPALRPAILAGAMFAFFASFDDLIITLFVSGAIETLPLRIWNDLNLRLDPTVAAAACVMVAMSMVGLGIAEIARSAGLRRLRTEQADG